MRFNVRKNTSDNALLSLCVFVVLFGCLQVYAQASRPLRSSAVSFSGSDVLLILGWEFRSLNAKDYPDTATWHSATVPGVVPTDLLAAKLIPDPFFRDNEKRLQWIGLTDWEYRTRITLSSAQLVHQHMDIVFDGLDTFADVFLNEHLVLHADNMFRRWRVNAKPLLHLGENSIRVVLHSAITTMIPTVKAMDIQLPTVGQVQIVSEEGVATDPYVRKAPYSYGWDWGPRFVNEGIWKDVHLVTWDDARADQLHISQNKVTSASAELEAQLDVMADKDGLATVHIESALVASGSQTPTGAPVCEVTRTVQLTAGTNHILLPFEIKKPLLWNPAGYGLQPRYDFRATLTTGGEVVHAHVRTGLRSVELRRDRDSIGESFAFIVNGKPIFAKGADVIPFDSFAPRVTAAQHRQILQSAVDAHMNMVREWGGGYYESDDFYDITDELGILVWQEFMFGGAQIPGGADFRENVREEAIEQVDRLRDHPSLVLWCGNNEVETGWFHWGPRIDFRKALRGEQQSQVWQDYLLVMDDVLKGVVASHDPQVPYTPSSPHSEYDQMPDIQTAGDMHSWAVWGQSKPVSYYNQVTPRFMSEFGFQSFPEMRTIRAFAEPNDLALTSPVMLAHQKNENGNERIRKYMEAEYPAPKDFASFVYVSQVQQAEVIRVAVDHLRSSRPRTMGALYWQLNDCWPVASWSSIDYYGRWKVLQYYAKNFYADLAIAPYRHDGMLDITLLSDLDHSVHATLGVMMMSFDGQTYMHKDQAFELVAAAATPALHLSERDLMGAHSPTDTVALFTLKVDGVVVASRSVYFEPTKNQQLPVAKIESSWSKSGATILVTLRSRTLARNVWISFGDKDAELTDNSFDLLPNQPVTVEVKSAVTLEQLRSSIEISTLRDAFAVPSDTVVSNGGKAEAAR